MMKYLAYKMQIILSREHVSCKGVPNLSDSYQKHRRESLRRIFHEVLTTLDSLFLLI